MEKIFTILFGIALLSCIVTNSGTAQQFFPQVSEVEVDFTFSDLNDSAGVIFNVTFSEDVQLNDTNNILIYQRNDTVWEEYEKVVDSLISITGNVMTVSPERRISSFIRYQFVIMSKSVTDLEGNPNPYYGYVFTADTLPPQLTGVEKELVPVNNQDSVNVSFVLSYNENVQLSESHVIEIYYKNAGLWEVYELFNDSNITIEGNTLSIVPEKSLYTSGTYELVLISGSVVDRTGNRSSAYTEVFMRDSIPPQLTGVEKELVPVNNQDSVNVSFVLSYNENVQLSESHVIEIYYKNAGLWEVYELLNDSNITIEGSTLSIVPEKSLYTSGTYELVLISGSVVDRTGNRSSAYTEVFMRDSIPPQLTGVEKELVPVNNQDSVNVSFVLSYNENVQLSESHVIEIYYKNAGLWEVYELFNDSNITIEGNTLSIVPEKSLYKSGTYELVLIGGSVVDGTGNRSSAYTEVFMRDTIPPKLVDVNPDLNMPVPLDASFILRFDEDIEFIDDFQFNIYYWHADSVKYVIYETLDSTQVTIDENIVTFNPSLNFLPTHRFQVALVAGSVLDFEGNRFINVTGDDTLTYFSETFWTADKIATDVTFIPEDGDSINYVPEELTINFSNYITLADSSVIDTSNLDSLVYLRYNGIDLIHEASFDTILNTISIVPLEKLALGNTYSYGFLDGFINSTGDSVPSQEVTFFIFDSLSTVNDYSIAKVNGDSIIPPMLGQVVRITGTVTGVQPEKGFFVQDDIRARSGIWVEYIETEELNIGEGVVVSGLVDRSDSVTVLVAEEVISIIAPLTIEPVFIDFNNDSIQLYQGMLVQVSNARASSAGMDGLWTLNSEDEADSIVLGSQMYGYIPAEGNSYDLSGIITGWEGKYRIEPRIESDIVDVTVPTHVDLHRNEDLEVYPNPFENYIKIRSSEKISRVVISNIAGKKIVDVSYPEAEINTSHLVSGVYIITIFKGQELVLTNRIIKQ